MLIPLDTQLLTPRCRMRCPREDDAQHVWSVSRFPGFADGLRWDPPASADEIRPQMLDDIDCWRRGVSYPFAVEGREDGSFIGWVTVRKHIPQSAAPGERLHEWSLGYWVHPDRWGSGFATETAGAGMRFGFERLGAEKIIASCATWNAASIRVLEKLGMMYVKRIPRGFEKRGQWVEEDLFELTRAAWEARPSLETSPT